MSDSLLKKIDEKLDKVIEEITEIKVIQAKHDINLQNHMQASNTLKALYDNMQKYDIEPLKADMNKLHGAGKFIALLGILATIAGVIKMFVK